MVYIDNERLRKLAAHPQVMYPCFAVMAIAEELLQARKTLARMGYETPDDTGNQILTLACGERQAPSYAQGRLPAWSSSDGVHEPYTGRYPRRLLESTTSEGQLEDGTAVR